MNETERTKRFISIFVIHINHDAFHSKFNIFVCNISTSLEQGKTTLKNDFIGLLFAFALI